jgi:uncharacterized protein
MGRNLNVEAEVFLDTAYAIALSSSSDHSHTIALRLADELEEAQTRLVTARAILMEIGNALSKQHFRHAAVDLLQSLEDDPHVEIVPFSEQLYAKAFKLYRERPDFVVLRVKYASASVKTEIRIPTPEPQQREMEI